MLERRTSASIVHGFVNHPAIRPDVGPGNEPLDLTDAIACPENIFLMGEFGGFALIWTAPRTYEAHVFIMPEGRGCWAFQAVRHMLSYMQAYGARAVWARISPCRPEVEVYTRRAGFSPTGDTVDTFGVRYPVYVKEF